MRIPRHSGALLVTTAVMQLIWGTAGWSAEPGRSGPPLRALVAGLQGDVLLLPDMRKETPALRFHDVIDSGDQFTIGAGSMIDVLIGKQTLMTVYEQSTVRLHYDAPGQTVVEIHKGELTVAVARGDQSVTVRTPGATALTYGALIRVTITPDVRTSALPVQAGAVHQARTVAPSTSQGGGSETFQIMEGMVQMQAPGSSSVTLRAGESLHLVGGSIAGSREGPPQHAPAPLPATATHGATALRAVQHVVDREKAQAEALQRALLEGVTEALEPPIDFRNVILSTSLGIIQAGGQGALVVPGTASAGGAAANPVLSSSGSPVPPAPQISPGVGIGNIPAVPPPTLPSPGVAGSAASNIVIPPPARPLPSLPSLLGTLDLLQFDRGKAIKEKFDKDDRREKFDIPEMGRRRR